MFKVELDVSCLDKALNGLKPGGEVQRFVDTEIIKHCDPYVPFDTGMLKGSPLYASRIGYGEIIYDTPYARRMYTAPDDWNFQNGPLRGPTGQAVCGQTMAKKSFREPQKSPEVGNEHHRSRTLLAAQQSAD